MLTLDRKKFLLFISAVVIAINIARCPELLLDPRFFAEEGTTYFSGAFQKSFFANIFSAHYGYYTLYNQIATSLATLAPLENAPLVTTIMSLLVQVGISLYVLWGELPLVDKLWQRTVLALAIPLVSWPGHWLTIIGTQSWFGVGTFLLLVSSNRCKRSLCYTVRVGYLLVAGLTGVVSCFMAPAYLWRAFREKSREFLAYAVILFSCLSVHAGLLLAALQSQSQEISGRFIFNSFGTMIGKTIVYQFAVPFTGRGIFEQQFIVNIGTIIKTAIEDSFGVYLLIYDHFIIPLLIGITVISVTAVVIWQNRSKIEVQILSLALITVSILSNLCSVNSAGGPRYYFIPSLIMLTLYICLIDLKSCRPIVLATGLLVLTTFVGNGYEYRSIMNKQAFNPEYPSWRTEVALWRMTPSYQMSIWPAPWKMNLDKRYTRQES
jgi:uncharacterized membrane protein YobD (UPF0266 family)